jgi:hypothetical protein
LTPIAQLTYETSGTYETNQKAVDQTDAEKRADLFRVHLLRRRGLIERDLITAKAKVDSHPYSRQRGGGRLAAMELCMLQLRGCTHRKNCATNAIEHCDQLPKLAGMVLDQCIARFASANRKNAAVAAALRLIAEHSDRRRSFDEC